MKQFKMMAALLFAATFGLTSCGDKKSQSQEEAAGDAAPKFQVPADAKPVTDGDIANGKTLQIEKIVLGNQQYIGDDLFKGNTTVKELWLKNGFQFVGKNAFEGVTSLEKIVAEGKTPVFNDYSFKGCTGLKSVSADVETIGIEGFKGCTSLESVKFGNSLFWLRESCFEGCTNLKQVLLSVTVSKYEANIFKDCPSIEEIAIPSSQTRHLFGHLVDCKNIHTVYLLALEFHAFPEKAAAFPCEQVDLYVPDAMIAQYKGDASWGRFKSIKPLSESKYYQGDCWCK